MTKTATLEELDRQITAAVRDLAFQVTDTGFEAIEHQIQQLEEQYDAVLNGGRR